MRVIVVPEEFAAWRTIARECLREGWLPEQLDLQDASAPESLVLGLESDSGPRGRKAISPHVPKLFLEAAEIAARHRSPDRWNLLYRLLYRLQSERGLLLDEIHDDVARLNQMRHQV